ncbi:MAG: hypothetical protein LBK63_00715 [Treponema sp.]|nr:hypothetical protein [Treponema sp.]
MGRQNRRLHKRTGDHEFSAGGDRACRPADGGGGKRSHCGSCCGDCEVPLLREYFSDDQRYLYLGRLYCQAPEVDGLTTLRSGRPLAPGTFVRGRISGRTGFDLEMDAG